MCAVTKAQGLLVSALGLGSGVCPRPHDANVSWFESALLAPGLLPGFLDFSSQSLF